MVDNLAALMAYSPCDCFVTEKRERIEFAISVVKYDRRFKVFFRNYVFVHLLTLFM